jgi:hypothetical protein
MKEVILVLLFFNFANATTYIVDNATGHNGSDGNSGTESAPFLTFKRCVDVINEKGAPGDTCLIKDGIYKETASIVITRSGTAAAPITYKNYPNHKPVIRFPGKFAPGFDSTPYPGYYQIYTSGSPTVQYITLEGLEITNSYYGIHLGNADHFIMKNLYIHDIGNNGIAGNMANSLIDGLHCHSMGPDITIKSKYPIGTTQAALGGFSYCIYPTGKYNTIQNSVMYNTSGMCIQLAGYPAKAGAPSTMGGLTNFHVYNNTCAYTLYRNGLVVWGGDPYAPYTEKFGIEIKNNIFYQNCTTDPAGFSGECTTSGRRNAVSFLGMGNVGALVYNNLCYEWGLPCLTTSNSYGDGVLGSTFFLSSNRSALPGFIFAPLIPTYTPEVNPNIHLNFVPNFHLANSTSPAIDMGLNTGVVRDKDENSRVGAYDAGAYEFLSGVTPKPAVPQNLMVK